MRSCTGQIRGHVKLECLILPLVIAVCCLMLTVQALVLELLSLIQSMRKKLILLSFAIIYICMCTKYLLYIYCTLDVLCFCTSSKLQENILVRHITEKD